MPGIYLHIPFCKQACHYCDFHFSTSLTRKEEMMKALHADIGLQKNYFSSGDTTKIKPEVGTVYFGGGTPSLLSGDEIRSLLDTIRQHFTISPEAEITLEANPDDLDNKILHALKGAGINRLSIGIQSFYDEDLRWMNRAHDSKQALTSLKAAQDLGFNNITIDLIYGTPVLTDERWKKNVQMALDLEVPHLSCYALTVEPRTALAKKISQKKTAGPDEQKASGQFEMLMEMTASHGFEHYEISNFARGHQYSRHNSSYWKGEKYLGIGPSAHSYDGDSRQWNIRNNIKYIESIRSGIVPFEKEILTKENKFNEYVMTSLRTMWGCDLKKMGVLFGQQAADNFLKEAQGFLNQKLLEEKNGSLILTRRGKHFADKIASELFTSIT